ncbi:ComEC/Rec2 family competence protein [Tichowtungia aerotolerans]|uniref:DUF4131 domain-containing protein n=1 Tax=Tichowtungia aerotolerans TaxID=2697043 RepID=A0A6P1M4U6_9BACT|nr:ComEC/Rec2 family competence protein [Tichowtungia aerotolerans]QHI68871.1 DUF4131 domain-containing protein [Tichowtungia aerotolerans]
MRICPQVRRPLVGLALSMVLGLYLQQQFNLSALLLLGLSACALSLLSGGHTFRRSCGVYVAVLLLSAAYSAVESIQVPAKTVLPAAEVCSSSQEIIGTIDEDPKFFEDDAVIIFNFRVDAVRFEKEWHPADFLVRVRVNSMIRSAEYGERWHLKGRFRSFEKAYGGVGGAFYTDRGSAACLRKAPVSLRRACYSLRRRASSALGCGLEQFPRQAQLLQALLLGYRHELPNDLYQVFSRTGTLHIFAISGLHVGVMAAILIAFLKIIGVAKPKWGLFLIPLLLLYVVSTGMKASAFRALTMASVYFAAPLFHRRSDTVSAISLAAILLLAVNPFQLNDPGFLLSFTVVCGIVMVHLYTIRQINGVVRPGRVVWAGLGGPKSMAVFLKAAGLLMITSFAAWIFSAPLTAGFFNSISPVALGGNLLIIPLTFMIVLTGCCCLLVAPVSLSATIIFNHANRIFISLLMGTIHWLGRLPGAYRFVRSPSFWVPALWYIGLVVFFAGPVRCRKYGLLSVLCAGLLWIVDAHCFLADRGIHVEREAGFAVMVSENSRAQILSAKGDSYSLSRAVRFLKRSGVNQLPVLALVDSEIDACSVDEICQNFSVDRVWVPVSFRQIPAVQNLINQGVNVGFSDRPGLPAGSGSVSLELSR